MSDLLRRALLTALVVAGVASAGRAHAQAASDAAAAEALFVEAQKRAAAGDYASACPKFAESLRLDTGIGVMLYLADCYEHIGKSASAWAEFKEAEELATKQGDRRADAAHQRAAALEPTLARLVIRMEPGADVAGLEVRRDATLVGRPQWGMPVPVDPGPHVLVVSAPGKKTRSIPVQLAGGAPTLLTIAPLEDEAAAPEGGPAVPAPPPQLPDTPPDAPPASNGSRRAIAYAVGGAGVVGLIIGSAFGFDTISKNNAAGSSSKGGCHTAANGQYECNSTGLGLLSAARTSGLVSDVAFAVGAAAVAGGAVLYLTAPRPSAPTVGLAPAIDPRGGGLLLSGRW